ncbi:MAG: EamA family transporter [Deltaproteobacteria bacterium]|nr:EamA family transporter [Deltaproteobacteria bacterium]
MDVLHAGELYSVACAALWAVATILFRKSGEEIPPVALNLFKNTLSLALFAASLALRSDRFFPAEVPGRDWAVLLLSGAVGIGIADSLFFAALNRLGASGNAIVSCLYAPLAVLASFAYLHESIGLSLLAATALMVGAILLGTRTPATAPSRADARRTLAGVALGSVSMLLMAVAIVFAKPVLDRTDPWWATTVRVAGGLVFLGLQGLLPRHRADVARAFRPGRAWTLMVPATVIGSYLAMIAWIAGMKYAQASTAAVLNQTSTLFTVVLGWLFLREAVTARRVVAVAFAFAGAVIAVT